VQFQKIYVFSHHTRDRNSWGWSVRPQNVYEVYDLEFPDGLGVEKIHFHEGGMDIF